MKQTAQQWVLGLSISGAACAAMTVWLLVAMAVAPREAAAKPAPSPAAPEPVSCTSLLSAVDCQHMMRARLAYPDTAEFSGILMGDPVVCGPDGKTPRYVSSVTSKNAFGVSITTRYMCTLDKSKALTLTVLQ